jgi:hypothetical protein
MASSPAPTQTLQGIEVPAANVDAAGFFKATRRQKILQDTRTIQGPGLTDTISVLASGIISGFQLKFSGSLVITLNSGTCASSPRFPYDIIKACRFSANGQSNLINCSGAKLKARQIMGRGALTDRGVVRGVGGASPGTQVNQGTMSLNNESWGIGSNVTAIAGGTYDVELEWYIPVAFDDKFLAGAIFAQTSATALEIAIDWDTIADLFTLTGAATAVLTGTLYTTSEQYTIPTAGNGSVIVPDLSTFHAMTQFRYSSLGTGANEIRLSGQGVGKQLLRTFSQIWNGAAPGAPLVRNATNFGQVAWLYGGNTQPETYQDGRCQAYWNESTFDADLNSIWGFGIHDFVKENAFRDSVDEGAATELRLLETIQSGVSLSNAYCEVVQEFQAIGAAA